MGHGVRAALPATLLVAPCPGQTRQADRTVREHGRHGYITGQLLRNSLIDGTTEFVNAGHSGRF